MPASPLEERVKKLFEKRIPSKGKVVMDVLLGLQDASVPERDPLERCFEAGWKGEKYPYEATFFYISDGEGEDADVSLPFRDSALRVWPEGLLTYAKRVGLSSLIKQGNPPGEMDAMRTILYAPPLDIFERLRSLQPQIELYPVNPSFGTLPQSVEAYIVGNVVSAARMLTPALPYWDSYPARSGEPVYAVWKEGGEKQQVSITIPVNLAMAATQLPLSKPARLILWEAFNTVIPTYDEKKA